MNFAEVCSKRYRDSLKLTGELPGYYLKIGDGFYYVSATVDIHALESVAEKVLNNKTGFNYWIDYSNGLDVTGKVAWSNLDFTDRFF